MGRRQRQRQRQRQKERERERERERDVGEEDDGVKVKQEDHLHETSSSFSSTPSSSSSISFPNHTLQPTDLIHHYQEHYDRLNESLAGTDHSWTALTLKLCTSVETANKLIQSTNSNARLLLEKVEELQRIVKMGDSTVAAAKAVNFSMNQKDGPFASMKNIKQSGSH